jgi:hypothetical protein
MENQIVNKFKKCESGKTYLVKGKDLVDNTSYWYFFKCISVSGFGVEGKDYYSSKETLDHWAIHFEDITKGNGVITDIIEISKKDFEEDYPEYFV